MKLLNKNGKGLNVSYNFTYEKPSVCPYCGFGTDAIIKGNTYWSFNEENKILIAVAECTSCGKRFMFASEVHSQVGTFATMYPQNTVSYQNDLIKEISERFIDLYNQSLDAESRGAKDLASFGFRAALEVLIKDYAIKELKQPIETVKKKTLCEAIGEYLEDTLLAKSADVVRILGNDYAHYERKYPEQDFEVLKKYMKIFISLVEIKLMAAHPPVSRQQGRALQVDCRQNPSIASPLG